MAGSKPSIGRSATGRQGGRQGESGQMLMVAALALPVLVAITGLVLDGGMVYQMKRRMQTAADAAAMGGAWELWRQNTGMVTTSARADAALNGFTNGVAGVTVTVNNPPASGPRAGNSSFVEVIISRDVSTTLLRIVGRQYSTVKARAVAGLTPGSGGCVMAMDPDDRAALKVSGTSTLTSSCGVMVNSSDSRAIEVDGGGCIYSNAVGVSGGWNNNGSANCINPPPDTDLPPALDPLAYLPTPPIPSKETAKNLKITGGVATLNPGLYTGGIEISGGTVTFNPGVYILDGGGLKISGNPIVTGTGVMFYNTRIGGGSWGDFDIAGTAKVNFTAPDSGTYEGMLFWNDKNAPAKNPQSVVNGTSDSQFLGALYFPSSTVTWAGTNATTSWTQIIANTITITGNAVVNGGYSSTTVQPPTRLATLVE